MQSIRQIQELNKRELENNVSPDASWHTDYRDTAYVYIGGLPFELSEGDVITIFSQYGEPTYINLIRDKETGKSKGFAFLKYEDQRSTDLAVDNLGGLMIMGRTLKVDHTRYKKKDDEAEEGIDLIKQIEEDDSEGRRKRRKTDESEIEDERAMLKEEVELAKLIQNHDDEDPMKAYLVEEKKEEVTLALARLKDGKGTEKAHKHRHRHHKSRRPKDDGEKDGKRDSRHHSDHRDKRRSRSRESPERDGKSIDRHRRGEIDTHGNRDERGDRERQYDGGARDSRDGGNREREGDRPRRRDDSVDRRQRSRRDS